MNQSDENRKYIEAIKLAAGSVQYKNLPVQETMVGAVAELYKYYEYTKKYELLGNRYFAYSSLSGIRICI